MNRRLPTIMAVTLMTFAGPAAMAQESGSFKGAMQDAWLTGRIESMYLLNPHLSPFSISTTVDNGVVLLSGTVESEVDRELAGVLAMNIDGVSEVHNEIQVDTAAAQAARASQSDERRNFGSWVDDATTTASVKTRLIRNASTKGLKIDVDTKDDIVTLSGRVETAEEKALAQEIALNSSDVVDVRNNLVVDPS
jgi:hyperosmotically inducible protein